MDSNKASTTRSICSLEDFGKLPIAIAKRGVNTADEIDISSAILLLRKETQYFFNSLFLHLSFENYKYIYNKVGNKITSLRAVAFEFQIINSNKIWINDSPLMVVPKNTRILASFIKTS